MRKENKPFFKRLTFWLAVTWALAVSLGWAVPSDASRTKIKLAVLPFETQGDLADSEGRPASRALADWLTLSLVKNGRFEVLERHLIDQIIREHRLRLSAGQLMDGASASRVGSLLGVDAVITGSVVRLGDRVDLNLRVIDVQTAAIRAAENLQASGWEALKRRVPELVLNIAGWFPLQGTVVSRDNQRVVLDMGRQQGVRQNMMFTVNRLGDAIIHPQSGLKLGVEETPIGEIRVLRVDDQVAYARILSESGSHGIRSGDQVEGRPGRRVPTDPSVLPAFPETVRAPGEKAAFEKGVSLERFLEVVGDLKQTRLEGVALSRFLSGRPYWPLIRSDLRRFAATTTRWHIPSDSVMDQALAWLCMAIEINPAFHAQAVSRGVVPYRQNRVGMQFVYVPAGRFVMGSPPDEAQRGDDEHPLTIRMEAPFYIMNTEVTQAQWQRVLGQRPSFFADCGPHCPVEQVSWEDIQLFLKRLNIMTDTRPADAYGLPHEAQWEYVCRAGGQTPFSGGDCLDASQANFDGGYPYPGCAATPFLGKPLAVGQYAPNRWGIFDLHGNLLEWCRNHPQAGWSAGGQTAAANRLPRSDLRAVRGGSWYNGAGKARCAARFQFRASFRNNKLGFRLMRRIPVPDTRP